MPTPNSISNNQQNAALTQSEPLYRLPPAVEPDLDVDGLSGGIFARLLALLGLRRR